MPTRAGLADMWNQHLRFTLISSIRSILQLYCHINRLLPRGSTFRTLSTRTPNQLTKFPNGDSKSAINLINSALGASRLSATGRNAHPTDKIPYSTLAGVLRAWKRFTNLLPPSFGGGCLHYLLVRVTACGIKTACFRHFCHIVNPRTLCYALIN